MKYRKGSHSVFSVRLHYVFVTHYRRKIFTKPMLTRLRAMIDQVCKKMDCLLLEFNGEADHVHILLDLHPKNAISTVAGCLKSSTARMIKKEFPDEFKKHYTNVSFSIIKKYQSFIYNSPHLSIFPSFHLSISHSPHLPKRQI